jgi:hypothetical protein
MSLQLARHPSRAAASMHERIRVVLESDRHIHGGGEATVARVMSTEALPVLDPAAQ